MQRRIARFFQDEQGDWVAELECGHTQHVRHDPPWMIRDWVTTPAGRARFIGHELRCVECPPAAATEPSKPAPPRPTRSAE